MTIRDIKFYTAVDNILEFWDSCMSEEEQNALADWIQETSPDFDPTKWEHLDYLTDYAGGDDLGIEWVLDRREETYIIRAEGTPHERFYSIYTTPTPDIIFWDDASPCCEGFVVGVTGNYKNRWCVNCRSAIVVCAECEDLIREEDAIEDRDGYPLFPVNLICENCAKEVEGQ